ncbi:MAG: hypothetical protein ABIE70_02345 [bacterium]
MPRETSENRKIKTRNFVALPPGHISVQLFSNSGQVPLADLGYRITISPERILKGTTSGEGVIEHDNVPLGEYPLKLDDSELNTMIPAVPKDEKRYPVRVIGYMLFVDDEQMADDDYDDWDDIDEMDLNSVDGDGWEDLGSE